MGGINKDQGPKRVYQPSSHHHFKNGHGANPNWDHDPQRQIQPHPKVAFEPVLGQRESGHGPEQQDEEQRGDRDDHRVLEVEEEVSLLHHCLITDHREALGVWHCQRFTEDRFAGLEAVDQDHENREQSDQRVDNQRTVHGGRVEGICACLVHGRTSELERRIRVWMPKR